MIRQPVRSGDMKSVGYDEATATLELEFRDGSVHQYQQVPPHVHLELLNAPSKGFYFHAQIKDRYAAVQVT